VILFESVSGMSTRVHRHFMELSMTLSRAVMASSHSPFTATDAR
jgi:hypothetical protein